MNLNMNDYSIFVIAAYLISFAIIIIFACFSLGDFWQNQKKLISAQKEKDEKI